LRNEWFTACCHSSSDIFTSVGSIVTILFQVRYRPYFATELHLP
jgi:hypothetical protein